MHWTDSNTLARQNRAAGGDLSDADIANRVRMLMRDQLDHEAVCTMARNRIARLSYENACLRYYVEFMAKQAIDGDPAMDEIIHDGGLEDASDLPWDEAFAGAVIEARGKLEHIASDQAGLFIYDDSFAKTGAE
jgi:hypothetical protein